MDTWIISLAALIVTVLNIIISRAVAIGSYRAQHKRLSADIDDLKKELKSIMPNVRNYLFNPKGGKPIYVPVDDCEKDRNNCHNQVCERVDRLEVTLNQYIKDVDNRRIEERNRLDKTLKEIFEFVGEVRNHMKRNGIKNA